MNTLPLPVEADGAWHVGFESQWMLKGDPTLIAEPPFINTSGLPDIDVVGGKFA